MDTHGAHRGRVFCGALGHWWWWADLTAFGAGAIMVGWIIVEVLMLRQFSWLQWCYLVVGVALMGLAAQSL